MSDSQVTSAAPKLSAIQMIEQEIGNYISQREQAIANVHAVDGAIQAARSLVAKLRAEEAKAVAEAKKLASEVEAEAGKVIEFVKKEL
jgi:uncharacterized protein YpiB (UPF0302 family)